MFIEKLEDRVMIFFLHHLRSLFEGKTWYLYLSPPWIESNWMYIYLKERPHHHSITVWPNQVECHSHHLELHTSLLPHPAQLDSEKIRTWFGISSNIAMFDNFQCIGNGCFHSSLCLQFILAWICISWAWQRRVPWNLYKARSMRRSFQELYYPPLSWSVDNTEIFSKLF